MEDYLSKTIVDAGKEILKNQLHVYQNLAKPHLPTLVGWG